MIAFYKSTVFQSCSHSKSDRPWISRRSNKTCQIARLPGLAQYFENFERLLGREAYISSHNFVSRVSVYRTTCPNNSLLKTPFIVK